MIKDIEFAFFSQLSYLNWNNLNNIDFKTIESYKDKKFMSFLNSDDIWNEIKINNLEPINSPNGIPMYQEEDKRLLGVFGIETESVIDEKNKKQTKIKPLYNFDGWQFIYSADKTKLYKDKYNLDDVEDDGFFACAFMKDDDIVIAYRGTEITIKDFLTDLEIGFLNNNHSQLVSTHLFLEYIKSLYPNVADNNIHLTGHSLGGCLAQYAFISSDKKHKTITWNALGVGKYRNIFKITALEANENTMSYLKKLSNHLHITETAQKIVSEFITKDENIMLKTEEEDKIKLYNIINNGIQRNPFYEVDLNSKIKSISLDIYWYFKSVFKIQSSLNKASENITNYFNALDWTANIQTREGRCIEVLTGTEASNESTNDTMKRVISEMCKLNLVDIKFNGIKSPEVKVFPYHGVNDFLLYMDSNGMIQAGKYNIIFTKNLVKTLYNYVKKTDSKRKGTDKYLDIFVKGTSNKTEQVKPFDKFHMTCSRAKLFGPKISIISEANVKYVTSAIESLKPCVEEYINYREYSKEEKEKNFPEIAVYTIGHLSNVDNLAGIQGGEPTQLIKIEKPEPKEEEPVAKVQPKEEDKYTIKEGNATVTIHHLC
ncbi:hypothetical protein HMPREF0202_01713 [Cetobacterium somerae ATCC BAA-474]|uniref:Fungal lipase-like domain-containing protein n=1 Tax=Cetobacterium somerae ATCC BAA-474 TaxID=1319815 RepID=U7VB05_9FUSO|nr:Mbeg1-like protein [Cetobacterium somerae]ERT68324.1 hypothetical protein HMPREF0202_01713 [Cetobacterium somerae ATCC BAA-474]